MATGFHRFVVMPALMLKRCFLAAGWPRASFPNASPDADPDADTVPGAEQQNKNACLSLRTGADRCARLRQVSPGVAGIVGVWLVSLLSLSVAPSVSAAEWDPKPSQNFSQSEGISPARAAALVRSSYGGRVLSAAPASRGGSSGVVVRVLIDDGARVKTVFVDARGRMRAGR